MVLYYDIQVNKLFFCCMEQINLFNIICDGKIQFAFQTNRFLNSLSAQIMFENQVLTVLTCRVPTMLETNT